jgi:hypothetical protein
MATDFAYAAFFFPVLIGILVLLVLAFVSPKSQQSAGVFLGIGRRRIAFGYLGALVATLAYSAFDSVRTGYWKVDQGHITASEMPSMVPGWTLYIFVLMAPFVVLVLTAIGLPVLSLLRRFGIASVAGVVLVAVAYSAAWAAWVYFRPYNLWCESHALQCSSGMFISTFTASLVVALGFGLAARLPWLRSPRATT